MSSIVDFVRARLDDDENTARAALDGPGDDGAWYTGSHEMNECRIEGHDMIIYDESGHTAEQAKHIARHDPARVLRQTEALRNITDHAHYALDDDSRDEILRIIAAIWTDHPEYQPEWSIHPHGDDRY
jgi:hypothetical protein